MKAFDFHCWLQYMNSQASGKFGSNRSHLAGKSEER